MQFFEETAAFRAIRCGSNVSVCRKLCTLQEFLDFFIEISLEFFYNIVYELPLF